MVRPPGFEPGFPALSSTRWEAGVIDQADRQRAEPIPQRKLWTTAAETEVNALHLLSLASSSLFRIFETVCITLSIPHTYQKEPRSHSSNLCR